MDFVLRLEMDSYVDIKDILAPVNELKQKIVSIVEHRSYGGDIEGFMTVLRIFKFPFKKPARQFNRKERAIVVSADCDFNVFEDANEEERRKLLAQTVLKSIQDVQLVKMRPRDFDFNRLYNELSTALDE